MKTVAYAVEEPDTTFGFRETQEEAEALRHWAGEQAFFHQDRWAAEEAEETGDPDPMSFEALGWQWSRRLGGVVISPVEVP